MTSIKEWQDPMRGEVDGWDEAVDLMDEDDVKRWTEDKKLNPQKFKGALAMTVTSETMRSYLFADNLWLRAHAETLQGKAPKQESIIADNPGLPEAKKVDRPREDFDMPLSFWCNLGGVFVKGQKKHTAEALLWQLPPKANQDTLDEYGHKHFSFDALKSYKGEPGN